jgi:hypothetical protein
MKIRGSLAVATVALAALLSAPAAGADTADVLSTQASPPTAANGFLAGPCIADAPTRCSPATSQLFFKDAGGHPPIGFVHFNVRHVVVEPETIEPLVEPTLDRVPKNLRVDLPPGLSVNPEATAEKCSLAEFRFEVGSLCRPGTKIGTIRVSAVTTREGLFGLPVWSRLDSSRLNFESLIKADVFSLEPRFGEPALFGFSLLNRRFFLEPEIAFEGDYHESFTIRELPNFTERELLIGIHSARLVTLGNLGDGTITTLPTTCFDPEAESFRQLYSTWIRMDSYGTPDPGLFPFGSTALEGALPPGARPEGCENVPFDPSLELSPGTAEVDSPASLSVTTRLKVETPGEGGGPIATSHLRTAEVTLPAGMGLNPSGAAGLQACSDAALHKGDREFFNECPTRSVIGRAEIETPVLGEKLRGQIYVGEPRSNDPTSGELFRIFVEAGSIQRGVIVRLKGKVKADPVNGQLTAIFDDQMVGQFAGALPHGLPQVPFASLTLHFDGTPQAATPPILTTPPTCSRATATGKFEPWARPGTFVPVNSSFILTSSPAGGACPQSLAERPFSPPYTAGPDSSQAAAYSPLRIRLSRNQGHQELKRLELKLPKGMIGKLAGIPYCTEAEIAAAQGRPGAAERSAPSCPAASLLGPVATQSGAGPDPLSLPGRVYLAGPYKGAPISMVAIVPALSGPFDLGNVVVRVALHLDPETAQITAVTDPLPDVVSGVKVGLRTIDLDLDRNQFTLNPTSCAPQAITGTINGGGDDPANPAAFSAYPVNAPFRARGCEGLGFKPKLTTKLSGPTKRGRYPRLSANLVTRPGDANTASVDLTLPSSFFVAQEHITTLCTRPQLAARACPPGSAYGEAKATSPLLDAPLSGPVYLVPSGNQLPDLVADLRGQVDVQLRGVISSKKGGIRTVFSGTPDVPLTAFSLDLAGGKKSLIVNSKNICKSKRPAVLRIGGHNGAQLVDKKYKLKLTGCKKAKKRKKSPRKG